MAYTTQTFPQHGGFRVLRFIAGLIVVTLVVVAAAAAVVLSPLSNNARALAFHSSVVDRGSVVTLAPGAMASVTLRFRNAGFTPWERGVEGTQVDLGVKGDSLEFAKAGMAVGWLSDNRIATTTEPVVPPGADGTFTFTVRAPTTLGLYRIPVRLVVNNVTWLEDQETFVVVASDFGFHGELVDQSRHPTLRVGETSGPITVKFRNTGTRAWVRGKADQQMNLGLDGGDATLKALALGWPSADRVAIQTESAVVPGDAATFAFRVRAPSIPGTYALRLRPVVDGVTWLEGDAVLSLITVTAASGQAAQPQSGNASFTSTASVAQGSVPAGGPAAMTVTFKSASAASALLGVEIYAPGGGSLAYQKWFDEQSFVAGEQRDFPVTWQVPANAVLGTYSVSLRAFAPGWKSLYSSKDGAATLSIAAPVQAALPTAAPGGGSATAAPTAPGSTAAPSTAAPSSAPPSFTSNAVVTPGSVTVGGSISVSASFTSATATNALVTVEIYAPDSAIAVYQKSFDGQSFSAGQQRGYSMSWPVPSTATTGTYRVSLGVFSPGYGTQYSWTDSAATFAATAVPAPPTSVPTATATAAATASATTAPTASATAAPTASATTAPTATPTTAPTATPTSAPTATPVPVPSFVTSAQISPASINAGSSVNITAIVTSATTLSALVDIAVYAPDGTTVAYQRFFDGQSFTAGQVRSFPTTWQVPASAVPGTYKVSLGMFSPGWTTLYNWKDLGGTFAVAGLVPTPTPTAAPTGTIAPTPVPTPAPTPAPTAPPPAGFSAVHVQGNTLVNAAGQPVRLRGVSYSGTETYCSMGYGIFDGPSDQTMVTAMKTWKVNAVRIPMNEDCWLNINGVTAAYSGATYQNAIKNYVNLLNQNGLYALLELHWSAPGANKATGQQPMLDMDHSPTFWSQVATAFKGNNAVIFEPHNEPFPDSNQDTVEAWRCWRDGGTCAGMSYQAAGMQTIVNAIRATGATNVIALGGVQYSSKLTRWVQYKPSDPLNNLMAAWHIYNFIGCGDTTCWNANAGVVVGQFPVLATEVGVDNCDPVFLNALLNWLEAHQSGYLGWTWDTWGTACSSTVLISDYNGTPTTYGLIYKNYLAALLP